MCSALGICWHDLVPKDTSVHTLQTSKAEDSQRAACTFPQHYKFLVLPVEKWRRLRFMVTLRLSAIDDLWRDQRRFCFSLFLEDHNWRDTSLFVNLCTYVIEVRWFDLKSEYTITENLFGMKAPPHLCLWGHVQKAVTDQSEDVWNFCPEPAWCISIEDVPTLPQQGMASHWSLWNPLRMLFSLQRLTCAGRNQN